MSDRRDEIVVRAATAADVDALAAVYLSSARHHAALDPGFYSIPDRAAVVARFVEQLRADEADAVELVAELSGVIVGSASIELRSPSAASMLRLQRAASVGVAVLDNRRGRGIGSRLMEAAEDWAHERGAALAVLDASAANVEALRFYERLGYRRRGMLMTKAIGTDAGSDPYAPMKDLGWREIAEIDARLERGEIDEAGWHVAMADLIVPAYLAAETPWQGSGKQGSADDWEYARSHTAHAIDRPGSFLDIGCANGLPARVPATLDAARAGPIRPGHRPRAGRACATAAAGAGGSAVRR